MCYTMPACMLSRRKLAQLRTRFADAVALALVPLGCGASRTADVQRWESDPWKNLARTGKTNDDDDEASNLSERSGNTTRQQTSIIMQSDADTMMMT